MVRTKPFQVEERAAEFIRAFVAAYHVTTPALLNRSNAADWIVRSATTNQDIPASERWIGSGVWSPPAEGSIPSPGHYVGASGPSVQGRCGRRTERELWRGPSPGPPDLRTLRQRGRRSTASGPSAARVLRSLPRAGGSCLARPEHVPATLEAADVNSRPLARVPLIGIHSISDQLSGLAPRRQNLQPVLLVAQ